MQKRSSRKESGADEGGDAAVPPDGCCGRELIHPVSGTPTPEAFPAIDDSPGSRRPAGQRL